MIAKNISAKVLQFDILELTLYPGQDVELNSFTPQQRNQCSELQIAFQKGEMLLTGEGVPRPTEQNDLLREARIRFMGFDDKKSLPMPAFPGVEPPKPPVKPTSKRENSDPTGSPNRYAGKDRMPVADPRFAKFNDPSSELIDHLNKTGGQYAEEYDDEETLDPAVYVDRTEPDEPPIISLLRNLDDRDTIPGVIETTKWLSEKTKKNIGLIKTVTPKEMNRQKLDSFRNQQCTGIKANHQRCKNKAIPGYLYCFTHMEEETKKQYLASKRAQKI